MKCRDENAVVVSVEDQAAVVETLPADCASGLSCGCGGCSGPKRFTVPRQDLEVGDRVRVRTPVLLGYAGTVFLFVLPLAFFCAGIIAGSTIKIDGVRPDALSLGLALVGLGVAVAVARIADRLLRRRFPPEVRRVTTDAG